MMQSETEIASHSFSLSFHPLRQSTTPFTPNSSMSTAYESNTPFRPTIDDSATAPQGNYSVTIFGFTTLAERKSAIEQFLSESAKVVEDDSASGGMDVDGDRLTKNWVEIVYSNQWDAVRAVRRSGHVVLRGGDIWIGARWTVSLMCKPQMTAADWRCRTRPRNHHLQRLQLTNLGSNPKLSKCPNPRSRQLLSLAVTAPALFD